MGTPAHPAPLGSAGTPLPIEASARMVTAWAGAENRLYELVGSWAGSTQEPAAKIYFDACSQHHAWRGRLWAERLPARLVVPAPPGAGGPQCAGAGGEAANGAVVARTEAALQALAGLEGDAGRLAAYCRVVLARTMAAYQGWQRRCSPASDRPVARVLALASADVLADWQEGNALLASLLDGPYGPEAVTEAAAATSKVELVLARRGRRAPAGPPGLSR
ncbi:MAG: hypothetical protein ACRDZX_10185 [Acidimicrobiales bacterium]